MILDWNDDATFAALPVKPGSVARIIADGREHVQVVRIDTDLGLLWELVELPDIGLAVDVDGKLFEAQIPFERVRIEWEDGHVSFCRARRPLCTRRPQCTRSGARVV